MKVSQMNIQMDEEEVYVDLLYFICQLYLKKLAKGGIIKTKIGFKHIKSVLFRGGNTAQREESEN